jgi:hypothetical protein
MNGNTGNYINYSTPGAANRYITQGANNSSRQWARVSNGLGVFVDETGATGGLVPFYCNSSGTGIGWGSFQSYSSIGLNSYSINSSVYPRTQIIRLEDNVFAVFRFYAGTYGIVDVCTINPTTKAITKNFEYTLTAAQNNFTGTAGSNYSYVTQIDSSNRVLIWTPGNGTVLGGLTVITYTPATKALSIGNVVTTTSYVGPYNSSTYPVVYARGWGQDAAFWWDGYYFYLCNGGSYLKIGFDGTAFKTSTLVYVSKYCLNNGSAYYNTCPQNVFDGKIRYTVVIANADVGSPVYGWTFFNNKFALIEESLDDVLAYGIDIGIATTSAAKGATVTVAVKSSKVSPSLGAVGTVGSMTNTNTGIYLSTSQVFDIEEIDRVTPNMPGAFQRSDNVWSASFNDMDGTITDNYGKISGNNVYKYSYGARTILGKDSANVARIANDRHTIRKLRGPVFMRYVNAGPDYGYQPLKTAYLYSFDGSLWLDYLTGTYGTADWRYALNTSQLVLVSGTWYFINDRSKYWTFRNEIAFTSYTGHARSSGSDIYLKGQLE